MLVVARDTGAPVAFTRVVYAADGSDAGIFCLKAPGLKALVEDALGSQVVDDLAPADREYIVRKTQPSTLFGTNLEARLVAKGIDTVLVTGCTTSGCVRASVIDPMSYNFRTIVLTDGVGECALAPHKANLFDMEQKSADLKTAEEVAKKITELVQ